MDLEKVMDEFAELIAEKVAAKLMSEAPADEPAKEEEKPAKKPGRKAKAKKDTEHSKGVTVQKSEPQKPVIPQRDPAEYREDGPQERLEDARAVLAQVANKDRQTAIDLLAKYGVKRLPEVPDEKMVEFRLESEKILAEME